MLRTLWMLIPIVAVAMAALLYSGTQTATGDGNEDSGRIGVEIHAPQYWGDNNCSGSIDPIDSLLILRYDAQVPGPHGFPGCHFLGSNMLAAGFGRLWGDNDCSGSVNPIDSLKTLRFDAGLSVSKAQPTCPDMGSTPPEAGPGSHVAFCWLAVVAEYLVNGMGTETSCKVSAISTYDCKTWSDSQVDCHWGGSNMPDYRCDFFPGPPFDVRCNPDWFSGFPEFYCSPIETPYVVCSAPSLWEHTFCTVVSPTLVTCSGTGPGASFECTKGDSVYDCSLTAVPTASPSPTLAPTAPPEPTTSCPGTFSPIAIPDNDPANPAVLTLTDPGGGMITDLDICVNIDHARVGDLFVEVEHIDTGTTVTLIDQPGVPATDFGCGRPDIRALLTDESADAVEDECIAGAPAIEGAFRPNEPLSAFDGETFDGTWEIRFSDRTPSGTGAVVGAMFFWEE